MLFGSIYLTYLLPCSTSDWVRRTDWRTGVDWKAHRAWQAVIDASIFFSCDIHTLCVQSNLSFGLLLPTWCAAMSCVKLTPVLPVVLFAVWCASPCGQTKPSSPRHDAWSDNNLQKPAQTQRERQCHLQQQDSRITPCAYQGMHVHTSKHADRQSKQFSWTSQPLIFSPYWKLSKCCFFLQWLVELLSSTHNMSR